MFGSRTVHRIFGSALAGLLVVALSATSVLAQSVPSAEAQPEAAGASVYWWFYLSALGLAAIIPVGVFLYRRYGDEENYDVERREFGIEKGSSSERVFAEGSQAEGGLSRAEKSFFSADDASLEESSARMAFGGGGAQRLCPECGEKFPSSVVMCPYDSTPLEKIDLGSKGAESGEETLLDRQRCPGCGRRYPSGPDSCYHDGMRLRQDTVEQAEDAPVFKACRTCGWEGQTEDVLCPNDGNELTAVAPSEDERIVPPIPVLKCPDCGEIAAPGRGTCPEDGAVLTPLNNDHAEELPRHGWGPRRQICQECGDTFGGAAEYCTHDGAELVPMN